uniref:Major sperm protein n=1 Tax=Trichuris muris TaxID=70415 RepID=A0A5S6QXM5_TRIMR
MTTSWSPVAAPAALVNQPNSDITLEAPFTDWTTVEVQLTNPNSQKVAYIVKITRPNDYVVVPSKGFLEPNDTKPIRISRKPNVLPRDEDRFTVVYLCIDNEAPRVDMAWFSMGIEKRIVISIKHRVAATQ